MSGALRRVAALASRGRLSELISDGTSASSFVPRRLAGNLPVKPNKHIEDWAHMRENVDHSYRWTSRNIRNSVLFGLIAPFCVYKIAVAEVNRADDMAGRPRRDMWGSEGKGAPNR